MTGLKLNKSNSSALSVVKPLKLPGFYLTQEEHPIKARDTLENTPGQYVHELMGVLLKKILDFRTKCIFSPYSRNFVKLQQD